ncbi:MAG TPA: hypothetical protein VM409_07165 [Chloroflexia bacterium]|nr:hypothetical protein [Chloroflexia bacterium]
MDMRDRIVGNQPDSFLHKIAGIVPGYHGYVDRERRRDADKLLRMQLAHQYSAQRDRLNRVQQTLLRQNRMGEIGEIDRLVGVLQRFIDRLSTATYGYTGLFDPVKVEAQDLDQLYAFDMALASGVDQVSSTIDTIEGSDAKEASTSVGRLATMLDDLNNRLNQRADFLTSGKRLPANDYQSLVTDMSQSANQPASPGPMSAGYNPSTPGSTIGLGGTAMSGSNTGAGGSGEMARYPAGNQPGDIGDPGTPTANLNISQGSSQTSMEPGMSQMVEGNSGFSDMPRGDAMGGDPAAPPVMSGEAGTGIESASSPAAAPGAPGHDIVDGMGIANNMADAANTSSGTLDTGNQTRG